MTKPVGLKTSLEAIRELQDRAQGGPRMFTVKKSALQTLLSDHMAMVRRLDELGEVPLDYLPPRQDETPAPRVRVRTRRKP